MAAVSMSPLAAIPVATVQSAPAAAPPQVAAAQLAAVNGALPGAVQLLQSAPIAAAGSAAVPAAAPASAAAPGVPLAVPDEFVAKLAGAVTEGLADARTFAKEHRPHERWMVVDWAMLQMKWPPRSDKEELAYLHQVADSRTDAGVARARFWADHGLTEQWEKLLDEYAKKAGPAQARRARKLLHDTLMMMNSITQTAKAGAARDRPFAVDPTLELAVDKPGNNPSYPSGHTSAAYAACTVLAHLMPDRADEFMSLAREASWARVYAGVHFPSDVLAGAKLATTVASYLSKVSGTTPVTGTAPSKNTGVAGGRRAGHVPGAPQLGGTPINPPMGAGAVMAPGQPGAAA